MTTLHKRIEAGLVPLLEAAGFKKRRGLIFTRQLTEGFVGWLGLNNVKYPEGWEVNPVVGIRCQELEDLLSRLWNKRPHKYIPPTVSVPLGYLMPDPQFRMWFLREDNVGDVGADMAAAIVQYGIPFMASECGLHEIEALVESRRFTINDYAVYRLPLIKWLLGDRAGALQMCASYEQEITDRSDPAADQFRQFAMEFKSLASQEDV